ncbi:hypothetical protein G3A43_06960 [Paraburkholderia aspalathi]|nr:hypothetical protein [Paraburkholderia aspalathi]MBK3779991.1 hypothetical protein [Paraburkholderia aspalathi]
MCAIQTSVTPIATEVMVRGPAQFNGVGQFLGYNLHKVDEVISHGLAHRLVVYATRSMADAGFAALTASWKVSVYTINGEERPADRSYCVRWENEKGGFIEVVGILTRAGWPTLDHGFEIGQELSSC